jgi:hypothetical protein
MLNNLSLIFLFVIKCQLYIEEFEDTKGVIRICSQEGQTSQ